jgi:hypothetical protein
VIHETSPGFRVRRSAWCCAAVLAVASTPLAAATVQDLRISGQWVLDRAASDDFDRKLKKLIDTEREHMRPRHRRNESEVERAVALPDEPLEPADRIRTRLEEAYRPPAALQISLGSAQVTMQAGTEPTRVFNLDETVVRIDSSGTSEVTARWSGSTLVLRSRYTDHAQRTEQFVLDRDGTLMHVTLTVNDPGSGKLELKSTYRRGEVL